MSRNLARSATPSEYWVEGEVPSMMRWARRESVTICVDGVGVRVDKISRAI